MFPIKCENWRLVRNCFLVSTAEENELANYDVRLEGRTIPTGYIVDVPHRKVEVINPETNYTSVIPLHPASRKILTLKNTVRMWLTKDLEESKEVPKEVICFSSAMGPRKTMEDEAFAAEIRVEDTIFRMYGVLDGHGGDHASLHFSKALPKAIASRLKSDISEEEMMKMIKEVFIEEDKKYCSDFPEETAGTTFTGVLIGEERIYLINVGDSRSILRRNGSSAHIQTRDHKPSEPDEYLRIQKAGGRVVGGRVQGTLAVSRALGDSQLKRKTSNPLSAYQGENAYVSPVPEIISVLRHGLEDIIIACDGVYDVLSSGEVLDILDRDKDSSNPCESIIREALKAGTRDNITVMILKVKD
jgi:serine/threonine protein phosphatase PrpC